MLALVAPALTSARPTAVKTIEVWVQSDGTLRVTSGGKLHPASGYTNLSVQARGNRLIVGTMHINPGGGQ